MNNLSVFFTVLLSSSLTACGGENSHNSSGEQSPSQQVLINEINQQFPFTANQAIDVTYICGLQNSVLTHYFILKPDFGLDILVTDDTNQDIAILNGSYSVNNNQITLISGNSFLLPLNETTTEINQFMGMVSSFESNNVSCTAFGHGYNTEPALSAGSSYACPTINISNASFEDNTIEFILPSSLPFGLVQTGSIFRQKKVSVRGAINPIITQGYGIYRTIGNTFYAAFGNQFDDANLLKGQFENSLSELSIEQLGATLERCIIR